jgi:hypothetical protein
VLDLGRENGSYGPMQRTLANISNTITSSYIDRCNDLVNNVAHRSDPNFKSLVQLSHSHGKRDLT